MRLGKLREGRREGTLEESRRAFKYIGKVES